MSIIVKHTIMFTPANTWQVLSNLHPNLRALLGHSCEPGHAVVHKQEEGLSEVAEVEGVKVPKTRLQRTESRAVAFDGELLHVCRKATAYGSSLGLTCVLPLGPADGPSGVRGKRVSHTVLTVNKVFLKDEGNRFFCENTILTHTHTHSLTHTHTQDKAPGSELKTRDDVTEAIAQVCDMFVLTRPHVTDVIH